MLLVQLHLSEAHPIFLQVSGKSSPTDGANKGAARMDGTDRGSACTAFVAADSQTGLAAIAKSVTQERRL